MDQIDINLLEAWNRISRRVKRDRIEAMRRMQRQYKGVLTRPMREWCLAVRASDSRINRYNAVFDPSEAVPKRQHHMVTLDGMAIQELTKPIIIDWPGVGIREAAKILGRSRGVVQRWRRRGVLEVRYERHFRTPKDGWPKVWSPSPIDPKHDDGQPPHRIWGSMWMDLWKKLPMNFVMTVERVPAFRIFKGCVCFRGWRWRCPGRMNEDGTFAGCGRRCHYLFGPQPVWTLGRAHGLQESFALPEDSGLAGEWFPGGVDPVMQTGPGTFACKECWQLRSACLANHQGWNDFITHISGGLLYGREVERPKDICPVVRKRRPYRRRRRIIKIDTDTDDHSTKCG